MTSEKLLKMSIYSIWLMTGLSIAAEFILQAKLPSEILELMAQNPLRCYAWAALGVLLGSLAVASIGLLTGKKYGRVLFVVAVAFIPIYSLLDGTRVSHQWLAFFRDLLPLMFGIVLSFLFTRNNPPDLATARNIRILSIAAFAAFILLPVSAYYTDETIPALFTEYVELHSSDELVGLDWVALFGFLMMPISLILLFFRIHYAKYLFALALLCMLVVDIPKCDALTGWDAAAGYIVLILSGILVGALFKRENLLR